MNKEKNFGSQVGKFVANVFVACVAACLSACVIALTVRFIMWIF